METRHLAPFLVITFAITWGLAAGVLLFGDPLTERFGALDPNAPFWKAVFYLAVYAPTIAGFAVVGYARGSAGLVSFVRRLFRWRAGLGWVAAVLLGYGVIKLGARALSNAVTGADELLFDFEPLWTALPAFLLVLIDDPGPMEEFGWRGFALPLLQRKYSALRASLILGVIWGIWHLPSFYIASLSQSAMSLPLFLINTVVLALLFTTVYNSTGGTVLLSFLFHAINNFELAPGTGIPPSNFLFLAMLGAAVVAVALLRFGPERLGNRKETAVLAEEEET